MPPIVTATCLVSTLYSYRYSSHSLFITIYSVTHKYFLQITHLLQAISDPCPQHEPTHTDAPNHYIGRNVSRKDKNEYLLSTLLDLNDTKEAVYGALDAWVAWEQNFPIASLKLILNALEKQHQWHRVVQVPYQCLLSFSSL
ncbi:hypothetical protein PIB30_030971 [Stylosanthes scabra]|uniref:Death domain-containing protein n=1 Tax=Stylosanthes scabra TaxID=79078 RepID=A0ABU6TBZ3_9FABA|nr:hypothetical protein [Stylosanthes scabra]